MIDFRDVRAVRTIGLAYDERGGSACDSEVNAALALGWELLLIQQGEENPVFVLGWAREGEPAETPGQKASRELRKKWQPSLPSSDPPEE